MEKITKIALDGSVWVWQFGSSDLENYGWVKESDGSSPNVYQCGGMWEEWADYDGGVASYGANYHPEFSVEPKECPFCNKNLTTEAVDADNRGNVKIVAICLNHEVENELIKNDSNVLCFPVCNIKTDESYRD